MSRLEELRNRMLGENAKTLPQQKQPEVSTGSTNGGSRFNAIREILLSGPDVRGYLSDFQGWYRRSAEGLNSGDWASATAANAAFADSIGAMRQREAQARKYLNDNRATMSPEYYTSAMAALNRSLGQINTLDGFYKKQTDFFSQFDSQEGYDNYLAGIQRQRALEETDPEALADEIAAMRKEVETRDQQFDPSAFYQGEELERYNQWAMNHSAWREQQMEMIREKESLLNDILQQREGERITQPDLDTFRSWSPEDQEALLWWIDNRIGGEQDTLRILSGNPLSLEEALKDAPKSQRYDQLVERYGKDTVEQIARSVSRNRNAERSAQAQTRGAQMAAEDPWLSFLISRGINLATAPMGLHEAMMTGLDGTGEYSTADPNGLFSRQRQMAGAADRQNASTAGRDIVNAVGIVGNAYQNMMAPGSVDLSRGSNLYDSLDEREKAIVDVGGAYLYQGAASAADNALRTLTAMAAGGSGLAGEIINSGLAGMSAFGATFEEQSRSGASPTQAVLLATADAGLEYLTEKLPFDNLMKIIGSDSKGAAGVIKNILTQMASEAGEESIGLLGSTLAEILVRGDKSEFRRNVQAYRDSGMSDEEARFAAVRDLRKELGETAIVSALSGAMMAGGGQVLNYADPEYRQTVRDEQRVLEIRKRLRKQGADASTASRTAEELNFYSKVFQENPDAFVDSYQAGQDVRQYSREFAFAYDAAAEGASLEEILKRESIRVLKKEQVETAFRLGETARRNGSAREQTGEEQVSLPEIPVELEESYEINPEGKTIRTDTGETVTIRRFAAVGKNAALDVGGKEPVRASEISFPSADEALIYKIVGKVALNARDADSIMEYYRKSDLSASDFAAGLVEAFYAGRTGMATEKQLAEMEFAGKLPLGVRGAAYAGGKRAGRMTAIDQRRSLRAVAQTGRRSPGTVVFDRKGRSFDTVREASLKVMEELAKVTGAKIYVYESYEKDGERVYKNDEGKEVKAPNGYYDPKDGSIHVDLNAGQHGTGTMLYTVAHECTHFIKDWSSVKYRTLAELLVREFGEQGVSTQELVRRQMRKAMANGRELTAEEAFDEVVADAMESMLTKGDIPGFMARVQQRDQSLRQKLKDFFRELAQKLKEAADAYRGKAPDSVEGRLVSQLDEAYERLQAAFLEALQDAGKNYQETNGQKNTTREGGRVLEQARENKKNQASSSSPLSRRSVKQRSAGSTHPIMSSTAAAGVLGISNIAEASEDVKRAVSVLGVIFESIGTQKPVLGLTKAIHGSNLESSLIETGILKPGGTGGSAYRKDGEHELRMSNHSAHAGNFKGVGEHLSIALYKTAKVNKFLPGDQNVIEAVFKKDYLDRNPAVLKALIRDIARFIATGEYHDTAGAMKYNYSGSAEFVAEAQARMKSDAEARAAVKMSDRDPTAAATAAELERQNEKLREDVEGLARLLKSQKKGPALTKRNLEISAAFLKSHTGVTDSTKNPAPTGELMELLESFYGFINSGETLSWEAIAEKAQPVADWIQKHTPRSRERSEYARSALKDVLGMRIQLTDNEKAMAAKDYDAFRKSTAGSITLSSSGISITEAAEKLNKLYPGTFESVVTAENKVQALLDTVKGLRNAESSLIEYAYIRDMVNQDILRSVYDSYWRLANLRPEEGGEAAAKIRNAHRNNMAALEEEHREAVEKIRSKRERQMEKIRREYRTEVLAAVDDVRKKYEKRRAAAEESARARNYRERVEKKVRELMNMMARPTKELHVPASLQEPLSRFLETIDLRSPSQVKGKDLTIKDISYTRRLDEVKAAVTGMRTAMDSSKEDGLYALDVPQKFLDLIEEHKKDIAYATEHMDRATKNVYQMTSKEAKDLLKILNTISKAIRDIDKLHMAGAKARVSQLGEGTIGEMGGRKATKSETGFRFMWKNFTPTAAFERMGRNATQILDGLKQGQDKLARTIDSVMAFAQKTYTGKDVRAWEKEIHDIELSSGKTVRLTAAQIMSFYALSKRKQAAGHLTGGGIRVTGFEEKGKQVLQKETFLLTQEDIARINETLSDRQKEVAQALQDYMQRVGGRLINEISMARWDYMEATDEDYFPIASVPEGHNARYPGEEKTSLWSLLNKSFTKQLTENANDAIVVSSIFDVFADHMSQVAEYNAFALPLVDAMRWFNYRDVTRLESGQIESRSVRSALKDTLGSEATQYFLDLITDVNSAQKGGRDEALLGRILSRGKAASVGWNLRVAAQQPTAILRASMYLSPGDLAVGTARIGTRQLKEEMRKYSGIALWKSMGYYDLNVSRSVREQIKQDSTILEKFNDIGMWLPGKMDEATWVRIWAACKAKVQRTKQLSGEALLQETAKLFDEVIYHTQVVDSVLSKSSLMRSKSIAVKELTSFMSEPTMSLNILMSAFMDYEQGHTTSQKVLRGLKIGFTGYVLSATVNALVTALMDAIRDDDEYEEFWADKFRQALLGEKFFDGNLFAELNPLEKIVGVSNLISVIQGYDVKNTFLEPLESAWKLLQNIRKHLQGEGTLTDYGLIYNGLKVLDSFAGTGLGNLTRDAVSIWNTVFGEKIGFVHRYEGKPQERIRDAYKSKALTQEEAIRELMAAGVDANENDAYFRVKKWDNGNESKYQDLYDAALAGQDISGAMEELTGHGIKEKDALSELKSKTGVWYTDEESKTRIDRAEAKRILTDYFDYSAEEVEDILTGWDMKRDTGLTVSGLKDAFLNEELTEDEAVSYLVKYDDLTREKAQKKVEEWAFEKEWGFNYEDIRDAYQDGVISKAETVAVLVNDLGLNAEEAALQVELYDWQKMGLDIQTNQKWIISDYYEFCEPAGISKQVYMDYLSRVSGITGDDKKTRRMAVIDSLPLTDEQKDAIYFAEGWAASTLRKAPWH